MAFTLPNLPYDFAALEPHRVATYLHDTAGRIHLWYHKAHVLNEPEPVTRARLLLARAAQIVLQGAFFAQLLVHLGFEEADRATRLGLGAIEGCFRISEQRGRVVASRPDRPRAGRAVCAKRALVSRCARERRRSAGRLRRTDLHGLGHS